MISKRDFIRLLAAMPAAQLAATSARAAEAIVGVSWGGPWLDAVKQVAAPWEKSAGRQILWEAHEGGASAAIVAKVRAAWPNPKHDFIHTNDPAIHIMAAEGWLAPLDDLPSLKDIPAEFIIRDKDGKAVSAPHSANVSMWGYRTDLVPEGINSLSDLLNPKFNGGIGLRAATLWSGLPLVSLALDRGGNERNMDPAFDFLKELAKTRKVSGVFGSAVDTINSVASGVTAVTLASQSEWRQLAKVAPIKVLNRVPNGGGLKTFYSLSQFVVTKSPRNAAAKEIVEYLIQSEQDARYATLAANAPTNVKAPFNDPDNYFLKPSEISEFGYLCDFKLMSEKGQEWNERFNREIQPLLRG